MNPLQPQTHSSQAIFRLLLVVSLWQGPILWGHQHSFSSAGLTFHLTQCHANDDNAMGLGWHWHLSLPKSNQSCPNKDPLQPESPPTKLAVSTDAVSSLAIFTLEGPVVEFHAPTAPPQRISASSHGGFLSSFCPAHSPQQLLCLLNC